jgi:hypothetical protein
MAIAADIPAGQIARGRGGFMRNAQDTPYITDPTGALVKSGDRKGQPKRLPYGSPSSRGKLIENTYNLTKWGERRVVMGIGVDLALIADCALVAKLDPDSDEFKEAADRIVMRAKDAAEAGLAADRGSHGHALTEDHDEERDWIVRAESGEVLGLDASVQQALVDAWRAMLEREGLEILAVEASCVDDTWRLAGTLDRIARTTKELRFALVTGEVVTIPADTVLVLDVKSGKHRTRPDGSVMYWAAYAIQIASYAQSVPYDTAAETRGVWPWQISQQHALIAHLDVLGAIEGNPSCNLVYVDLVAGREHGGACVVQAKEWEARRDVFSVGQLPSDEIVTTASDLAGASNTPEPSSPPAPADPGEMERQVETVEVVAASTVDEIVSTEAVPAAAPVLTPNQQLDQLRQGAPDEGGPADPAAVAVLESHYKALGPAGSTWLRNLVSEAQRGHVPIHLKDNHTVRRFELVRGLVRLAAAEVDDVETLRCVLASVVGDVAHFPAVPAGHVLGTLTAAEAAIFAQRCDELVDATVPAAVDPATGHVVLQFSDLAAAAA